jgi:outer membrane cobalamin receptor
MRTRTTGDVRRLIVSSVVTVVLVFLIAVASAAAETLQGRVLDPAGRPVASAEVLLLRGQTVAASARTTADGRYGPVTVAPGRYDVVVVAPGLRLAPMAVDITTGSAVTRDLRLTLAALQESVIVSAAHVDTTTSRSASSTSVITRRELEQLQASSLMDALRVVPGINAAPSGTIGSQTSLFPRGGESDYTLVLVDGVPQNAFGGAFDAAHLATVNAERIEVVRGPQSALYGSGAIGGIVHVISANGGRPQAALTFEGGGYGQRASTASAAASAGAWSFGGGFDWLESAGDTRTFDAVDGAVANDNYERVSAAGSLAWSDRPSRRVRVDVRGGRNERGFPGAYGSDPEGLYGGLDTVSRGENQHASVGMSAVLRSNAAIDHRAQLTWSRAEGTFLSPFGTSDDESGRVTARYQMDARVGNTGLSAGTEVLRERATNTYVTDDTFSPIPVRRSNVGLFVEARPEIHARVFATIGVRTERIDRIRLAGDGSRPAFDSSVVWSTNPKVAVAWVARDSVAAQGRGLGDLKIRASAGTGIKAPTAFDIAFTDNPNLRPERSRSVDVGIEQQAWQSRLTLDATWFYNSYDDLIVSISQPLASASRYRTDNVANARSSGLEVGAAVRLTSALSSRVHWTWLDTEVLGVDSLPGVGFAFYEPGDALIRRPRHSTSVEITYASSRVSAFALVHQRAAMRDLEPNWASSVYTNPGRAHLALGAAARIAAGLEAYGRVTNAFDRQYEDVLGFPAMGRSAIIGLRVTAGR